MPRILKQSGKLAPYNRPWQLIRDAVHDLELQEKLKSVEIDMYTYHDNDDEPDGPCHQCLAGCSLSRRCEYPLGKEFDVKDVPPGVWNKMKALDCFRCGQTWRAFYMLGLSRDKLSDELELYEMAASYTADPEQFKEWLLELADKLEELYDGKPVPKAR